MKDMDVLTLFRPETARWFRDAIGEPTAAQREAWRAIRAGAHTLVSAPTGTGKTLAAFLHFLDALAGQAERGELPDTLQIIYISPLKALGNDIRENLRRPLSGLGIENRVRVAIRTGDTTAAERRQMLRRPPHILITTPESLYLLLTSQGGREMLKPARAVIVDELHAVIDTKRGAHLALSLARLDALCGRLLRRVGLSATIAPLETAANWLTGGNGATVVAPAMRKDTAIRVISPLPDMRQLPDGTIWPSLGRAVAADCASRRTVIAFLEGRAAAERLAHAVNALGEPGVFARTHHGCVSKEQRLEAEQQLRSGELKLLCATSSMELGIDVGDVDLVVQIGCPRTVSSALQRLGRAGHSPGRLSEMRVYPRTAAEAVTCGLTAAEAEAGFLEPASPPEKCLDVIAQHLVSMAAASPYTVPEALKIIQSAYPFRDITEDDLRSLLGMLAGDFEHALDRPARPRLLYDRLNNTVQGDAYSRMLAVSSGGTIPDRGWFPVMLADGTRLGELDEEYVFESRVGDTFLLGAFAWRMAEILRDRVIVTPAPPTGAQTPFWKGDGAGRGYRTGKRFGKRLAALTLAHARGTLTQALMDLNMDGAAASNAARHLSRQIEMTGQLPDDQTLLLEHFTDEAGEHQMMIHSVFGRRVNLALSLLLQHAASIETGVDVRAFDDDDGILLYLLGGRAIPDGLLSLLDPDKAEPTLRALLPATPLFSMAFRYNAARALMMGARSGTRLPLWVQRLRGAEALSQAVGQRAHPLMAETLRECMEDYLDIASTVDLLRDIRSGAVRVHEFHAQTPSPMALPLRRQVEATMMYEYSPIPASARQQVQTDLSLVSPDAAQLDAAQTPLRPQPENAERLHALLMIEGDLLAGETDAPISWMESLAAAGRALYIEPGLWICAEQAALYESAFIDEEEGAKLRIARRALRYRGAQSAGTLVERYVWREEDCEALLERLAQAGAAVERDGLYYHEALYRRAQAQTLVARRRAAKTLPPERYAKLLASRLRGTGSPQEQLRQGLLALCGIPFPARLWEAALLPARTAGYRPAMLDALLAQGEVGWRILPGERALIEFYLPDEIDEDAPWDDIDDLPEDERAVLDALRRRGASFASSLVRFAPVGKSVTDILQALALRGLAHADSFDPVRAFIASPEQSPRRSARARAIAREKGRWEAARGLRTLSNEELLDRAFAQSVLVCRETLRGMAWADALAHLRVREYTGAARRGYFVEGLSGAQFLREADAPRALAAMESPGHEIIWLCAIDPLQAWGRVLPHAAGEDFLCVAGTVVALSGGRPVAAFERQGERLRVFDAEQIESALAAFARDFALRRVYPETTRLLTKEYPASAADALRKAGFMPEMNDFTLWRDAR